MPVINGTHEHVSADNRNVNIIITSAAAAAEDDDDDDDERMNFNAT